MAIISNWSADPPDPYRFKRFDFLEFQVIKAMVFDQKCFPNWTQKPFCKIWRLTNIFTTNIDFFDSTKTLLFQNKSKSMLRPKSNQVFNYQATLVLLRRLWELVETGERSPPTSRGSTVTKWKPATKYGKGNFSSYHQLVPVLLSTLNDFNWKSR